MLIVIWKSGVERKRIFIIHQKRSNLFRLRDFSFFSWWGCFRWFDRAEEPEGPKAITLVVCLEEAFLNHNMYDTDSDLPCFLLPHVL